MPPADGSSTRGGSTSVRGRVRSPHAAELQAASVPIAQGSCAPTAAAPRDRQTDGRVAVSLNAPYGGGIISLRKRGLFHSAIPETERRVSSLAASASAGRDIGRFSLVSVSPRPLYAPAIVCSHIAMISSTIMHLYCMALHAAFSLIFLIY